LKKALVLNIYFLLVFLPLSVQADWFTHESQIFGTRFSLKLWAEDREDADKAIDQVETEMWRLHHMLSPYEPGSELSRINTHAFSELVMISSEMFTLLERSLYYGKLTDGAFDPSFSSIGQYYDYRAGSKPGENLTDRQIEEAKQAIDFRLIKLDKKSQAVQFLHPQMKLDLGGIAKGYAVDRAADILYSLGIQNASISAGGDMRILGDKSGKNRRKGQPWIIGIKNPRQEATAIRLPLENTAVSTSGDYERFFIDESTGERVHHILDPKTGKSAAKLSSVTVLGEKGLDTDPLSTSVFVLGVEKGLTLINSLSEYDAILIDTTGKVHFSEGLVAP